MKKSSSHPFHVREHVKGICIALFLLVFSANLSNAQMAVQTYGQLKVSGNKIVDKNNNPVVLRGMSLFWSQWMPKYYTKETLKWLRDDWCINVIRVAMAVDQKGYATYPDAELVKVTEMINSAIELGIYVIVDFHVHDAPLYINESKTFFDYISMLYKDEPNVMYEIWNEPLSSDTWSGRIKPYCETIIDVIRKNDPDNIIICGTNSWSQRVDQAAANPITKPNIAYTLHYYAGTVSHRSTLRGYATTALNKGVALFVTEYGTCESNGGGAVNADESKIWWDFLEANKIGYCNWAVSDKPESASALIANTTPSGGWSASDLTASGTLVRAQLISKCDKTNAAPTGTVNASSGNLMESEFYPNPFNNSFELNLGEQAEYFIYDMAGTLQEKGAGRGKITAGEKLQTGLYMLKIKAGENEKLFKISKN